MDTTVAVERRGGVDRRARHTKARAAAAPSTSGVIEVIERVIDKGVRVERDDSDQPADMKQCGLLRRRLRSRWHG